MVKPKLSVVRLQKNLSAYFLIFQSPPRERNWFFVKTLFILLIQDVLVPQVNLHYRLGLCERIQVRWGFPGGLAVKNPANAGDAFSPWVGKIPWSWREIATHSSILIWKSPGTEEPDRLQSMGRKKRHNFASEQQVRYQHYYMGLYFNQLVYSYLYSLALILKFLQSPM